MLKTGRLIIGICISFTLLVGWFAWSSYRGAPLIATENLRGAGLSIAAAIEQLAMVDTSLHSLGQFSSRDIAYYSLIDRHGIIRFHTNPALVGQVFRSDSNVSDDGDGISESRDRLGTGEEVYLLRTSINAGADRYRLVLALHTYRADNVIRRAGTGVSVVLALTLALWGVASILLVLLRREERHRREMQRREELARLGEMGALLAHEIRNPLAGIKGFAQLVEGAGDLEQTRKYASRIISQSLRLEALVEDLLSFAREERSEREMTDLSQLVEGCVALLRNEADRDGVMIKVVTRESVAAPVKADRVEQMLLNLLKNGIQAMPDGGVLQVEIGRKSRMVRIAIADTGVGIAGKDLARIFEPFWTSKVTGTGLGLALCRKVAEEHGGRIDVESRVGQGSTFAVELPVAV
jgi:two-component system sensor histidine kinase HydH